MQTHEIFATIYKAIEKVKPMLADVEELDIHRAIGLYSATDEKTELEGIPGAITELAYALIESTKKKPRGTGGSSTERVRRFRERQKEKQDETLHATESETQCNALYETEYETSNNETLCVTKDETLHVTLPVTLKQKTNPKMTIEDIYALNQELKLRQQKASKARQKESPEHISIITAQ